MLKEKTTRNLLICVLWVLKNVEKSVLKQWWTELPTHRLLTLLEILRITLSCFQYKVIVPRAELIGKVIESEMGLLYHTGLHFTT